MSNVPGYNELIASLPLAPALPSPTGNIVNVNTAQGIIDAVTHASPNSTIVIAKGHYVMPHDCLLTASHVTIRGETGDREDVILDGGVDASHPYNDEGSQFKTTIGQQAILKLSGASHVTVADLTFANCAKYGLYYFSCGHANHLKILNCKFHNIWARGIKGAGNFFENGQVKIPMDYMSEEEFIAQASKHGEIRHCLFVADTIKQNDQDQFDGDYIAGMDLMGVKDFVIADNAFIGIRGKNGGGRGAIFIWQQAERVTVENNLFYHCDRGISLGNPSAQDKRPYHIRDSVIRHNTVIGGCNMAIEVDYGNNVDVHNNTIESTCKRHHAAIQVINIDNRGCIKDNTLKLHGEPPIKADANVVCTSNLIESLASTAEDE